MTTPFLTRALFRSSRDPCVRSRPSSDKAEAFAGDSELGPAALIDAPLVGAWARPRG